MTCHFACFYDINLAALIGNVETARKSFLPEVKMGPHNNVEKLIRARNNYSRLRVT